MAPELKVAVERLKMFMSAETAVPKDEQNGWVEVHTADLRLILAALAEREWRPIETAPKDGSLFDVWFEGERLDHCWYSDGQILWYDNASGYADIIEPTHWQPLPDGPETQQAGERGE